MSLARQPRFGLALLAIAIVAGSAVQAQELTLRLSASGDWQAQATAGHIVDGSHFCSAAPDPWSDPDGYDSRATPFPFYRVVFGQASPEDEPDSPGPSLGLALSNYFAAARQHSDPANDSIELVIEGRHFVGHAGLADPYYGIDVSFRDDRRGGSFVARHLHEDGTGSNVIDVVGDWQCAPVAADVPEVAVQAHTLFAGAQVLRAEPTHLRLQRTELICPPARCADWRVIDQGTGEAFMARVDLHRLHLARKLRQMAETGAVELMVDGAIKPGDPPRVVARMLAGVQPVMQPVVQPLAAAR